MGKDELKESIEKLRKKLVNWIDSGEREMEERFEGGYTRFRHGEVNPNHRDKSYWIYEINIFYPEKKDEPFWVLASDKEMLLAEFDCFIKAWF